MGKFEENYRNKLITLLSIEKTGKNIPALVKSWENNNNGFIFGQGIVKSPDSDISVNIEWIMPAKAVPGKIALLVYPENRGCMVDGKSKSPQKWAEELSGAGYAVFRVKSYASGEISIPSKIYDSFSMSGSYNKSNALNGIQDIYCVIEYLNAAYKIEPVVIGIGECGIITAFAAAASGKAGRVALDLNGYDIGYDGDLVKIMPFNGIKRIGDIRSAFFVLGEKPLIVYNASETFDNKWFIDNFKKIGIEKNIELKTGDKYLDFVDLLKTWK